jgi:hypothetical protein
VAVSAPPDERRKDERFRLQLPLRVHSGYDRVQTPRSVLATTADASASGISLILPQALAVGQIVRLELLAPVVRAGPYRLGGRATSAYAVVRNVEAQEDGHRMGVKFFDFLGSEDTVPRPRPEERRRHPRFPIPVHFIVQQISGERATLRQGLSVAEDLSRGGAQLAACFRLRQGDIVLIRETEGGFETRAEITHAAPHADGLARLHVKFLDGHCPEHVVPMPV